MKHFVIQIITKASFPDLENWDLHSVDIHCITSNTGKVFRGEHNRETDHITAKNTNIKQLIYRHIHKTLTDENTI